MPGFELAVVKGLVYLWCRDFMLVAIVQIHRDLFIESVQVQSADWKKKQEKKVIIFQTL